MASNSSRFIKKEWGSFKSTMGKFHAGLAGNRMGGAALSGAAQSIGWDYSWNKKLNYGRGAMENKGFLGLKEGGSYRNRIRSLSKMPFRGGAKQFGGAMLGVAGKALGPVMGLMAVAEGYREGGFTGAISAGATSAAEWAATEMVFAAVGSTMVGVAAVGAAAGYAGYKFMDNAAQYGKSLKKLEMGSPIVDTFGTIATTRQRSLAALQNTHINGRMALGNEGMLMHTNVYSRR